MGGCAPTRHPAGASIIAPIINATIGALVLLLIINSFVAEAAEEGVGAVAGSRGLNFDRSGVSKMIQTLLSPRA